MSWRFYHMSRLMTKPTTWSVSLAKTQISQGMRPVFVVRSVGSWGPNVSSCKQWRLWSDRADWPHWSFCWFCHEALYYKVWVSNPNLLRIAASWKFNSITGKRSAVCNCRTLKQWVDTLAFWVWYFNFVEKKYDSRVAVMKHAIISNDVSRKSYWGQFPSRPR